MKTKRIFITLLGIIIVALTCVFIFSYGKKIKVTNDLITEKDKITVRFKNEIVYNKIKKDKIEGDKLFFSGFYLLPPVSLKVYEDFYNDNKELLDKKYLEQREVVVNSNFDYFNYLQTNIGNVRHLIRAYGDFVIYQLITNKKSDAVNLWVKFSEKINPLLNDNFLTDIGISTQFMSTLINCRNAILAKYPNIADKKKKLMDEILENNYKQYCKRFRKSLLKSINHCYHNFKQDKFIYYPLMHSSEIKDIKKLKNFNILTKTKEYNKIVLIINRLPNKTFFMTKSIEQIKNEFNKVSGKSILWDNYYKKLNRYFRYYQAVEKRKSKKFSGYESNSTINLLNFLRK